MDFMIEIPDFNLSSPTSSEKSVKLKPKITIDVSKYESPRRDRLTSEDSPSKYTFAWSNDSPQKQSHDSELYDSIRFKPVQKLKVVIQKSKFNENSSRFWFFEKAF